MHSGEPEIPQPSDYGWAALAAFSLVALAASLSNAVWQLTTEGNWVSIVSFPLAIVFWFWIGEVHGCVRVGLGNQTEPAFPGCW